MKLTLFSQMNDNGICEIPPGAFDEMSRLKMIIMKNNFLSNIFETSFYKLRNNIAFIDISGNFIQFHDCSVLHTAGLQ